MLPKEIHTFFILRVNALSCGVALRTNATVGEALIEQRCDDEYTFWFLKELGNWRYLSYPAMLDFVLCFMKKPPPVRPNKSNTQATRSTSEHGDEKYDVNKKTQNWQKLEKAVDSNRVRNTDRWCVCYWSLLTHTHHLEKTSYDMYIRGKRGVDTKSFRQQERERMGINGMKRNNWKSILRINFTDLNKIKVLLSMVW